MNDQKILIVDKDEGLCLSYKKEFLEDGYNVITANRGNEAVQKVLRYHPDLVIMDIKLPDEDGLTVMDKIVRNKKNLPVIINTEDPSRKLDFKTWLAKSYIVKSEDTKSLKNEVQRLLKGN